jgi:peptidoglycan/xylan/chitin deacetylase (PgdA/CDA1 family)
MSAGRVPVLMYHRVGEANSFWESRYAIPAERFAAHMLALVRSGYQAITIDSLVDWMEGGAALPDGAFVLTFDDGYRGVYEYALPVLEQMKWPFTVFLVSDLIGKEDIWSAEANPEGNLYPLLNSQEIQTMQQRGCCFHSHSRSHAKLPSLDDDALSDQILGSRQALGEQLGVDLAYLAYPYGQFDERVIAATKSAGYRAAFSTRSGFNQRNGDLFSIRRIDVYGTDTPAMLLRKIRLGTNDGSLKSLLIYYLRRIGLK